ncbi:MAG: hypothetical protein P1P90_01045 [Patescibacteria group bacterium]|nr:hypothetical protein [Patescibacteria group bacterium]
MGTPILRSNHVTPAPQRSKPVKFGKEDTGVRQIPRPVAEFSAPVITAKDLRLPQDGLVRGIASMEAKKYHSWPGFTRTARIIRKYCGLAMGFYDHELQVEQYIYLQLKRVVDVRFETLDSLQRRLTEYSEQISWMEQNVRHANAELKNLKKKRAGIERDIKRRNVHGDGEPAIGWRRWLEMEAERAIDDIRIYMLEIACNGKFLRKASHADYLVVLGNVHGYPSRKFMLIVDPASKRKLVVTIKTPREYRRGLKRFMRDGSGYRNEPQQQKGQRKRTRRSKTPMIVSKTVH